MTTLYDAQAKTVHDLSIVVDRIHQESDILGNMDITGDGTGIFYVDDFDPTDPEERERECYCTAEIEARALDCDLYAKDTESAEWWVRYVDDYNERLELIDGLRERLYGMDIETIDRVFLELGIGKTEYRHSGIEEWLQSARVDYEDEHNEFMARYEQFVAALDAVNE